MENMNQGKPPYESKAPHSGTEVSRKARRNGIRKGSLITGLLGLALLIAGALTASSIFNREKNRHLAFVENQRKIFSQQITERDSLINDWMLTFDKIEKDLETIKQKEKYITVKSSGSEFTKGIKEKVIDDIKIINTILANDKMKIAALNKQISNSGGIVKGLQTRIASLEKTIKQYETDITTLKSTLVQKNFEIGQLNGKLADMDATIKRKNEILNEQDKILNQAYLISGTYKELKSKGIILKDGGFLGLGRNEVLAKDLNDKLFDKVDIRDLKSIPVNSNEVKLITKHPSGSYSMIRRSDKKIVSIEIKDPDDFWKITRYAVVELSR
jgi:hypothetical protein